MRGEVAGYLTELTKGVPNVELVVVDRYLDPKLAKEMKVFARRLERETPSRGD